MAVSTQVTRGPLAATGPNTGRHVEDHDAVSDALSGVGCQLFACRRRHLARKAAVAVTAAAVLALTACAQRQTAAPATPRPDPPAVVSQYPTVADYNTLRSARVQVRQALAEHDWRRQQFAAYLGLTVLMSMHRLKPGRCAEFIGRTYDELLSLHDNYPGEDWTPLVATVRRDPPVGICRAPAHHRILLSA